MRLAYVPLVALASVTLVAAQSASIDPSAALPKIDMTRQAPQPTNVNVLNWPETQGVAGTVSVGNLPLAEDGAVRVTSNCPAAPPLQARYIDLLPNGPVIIQPGQSIVSETVDARGYTRFGIDLAGEGVNANSEWTWSNINELFAAVPDLRNGTNEDECRGTPYVTTGQRYRLICLVSGEQLRIRVTQWFDANPVTALGVYLIP